MTIEEGRTVVLNDGPSAFERLTRRLRGETVEKAGLPPQAIQGGPPQAPPQQMPPQAPPPPPEEDEDEDEDPKAQRPGAPVGPTDGDDPDGDGEDEGDQEYGDEDKDDDGDEDDKESPEDDEDEGEDEDEEDEGDGQPNPPMPAPPTRKSLAIDERLWDEYGDPDSEYLRGLEKSEHAETVDASPALIHAIEVMGRVITETKRMAVVEGDRAEGLEQGLVKSVGSLDARLSFLERGLEAIGNFALKSLTAQAAQDAKIDALVKSVATYQDTLEKSLGNITQGVELIKSMPAGTTSMGLNGLRYPALGDARPPQERPPVTVSQLNDAIYKSVEAGVLTGEQAANHMAMMNGDGGAMGVYNALPEAVKAYLHK